LLGVPFYFLLLGPGRTGDLMALLLPFRVVIRGTCA